ncbi:hypothetical protein SAMN05444722_0174 [Rhodovulum sp. ES.010]|uniref:hypothetical protein n=1 Tax=Rhodovulum sp. ES.010 TaxID=1882821 RepID=UPI00092B706C|nr:hypothetical protein [Rhodovulum sp. ES.010]SIO03123.1 hypothetical protein SAMN05444722_0174 [Rhodovulum sp. ES.010]
MDDPQTIYRAIEDVMRDLAPPDARVMVCEGKDYPDFASARIHWLDREGNCGRPFDSCHVSKPILQIGDLVRRLRAIEPFASQRPFTHYRIRSSAEMPLSVEFADIPPEQTWARVYMRAVGALSESEAAAMMVPREQWLLRKQLHDRAITLTEFDAALARLEAGSGMRRVGHGDRLT